MKYRVWSSTEGFADYIVAKTLLAQKQVEKRVIYESDANNAKHFHTMPDHIKKILYLDAPDIIVELDTEPIFSIEISAEAGTGHNVFQRFARLAASVENNVPAFYIYPEAVIIARKNVKPRWDKINPLIFKALDVTMSLYGIPALFYYFPSYFREFRDDPSTAPNQRQKGLIYESGWEQAECPKSSDPEIQAMILAINKIIETVEEHGVIASREKLQRKREVLERRSFMQQEYVRKGGHEGMSPLSATVTLPTEFLLKHLSKYSTGQYRIGELLRSRPETILYQIDSSFRGDPYAGAFAGIDYLRCREGKTFEERKYNLVAVWGKLEIDPKRGTFGIINRNNTSINDFTKEVQASEGRNLLGKTYMELKSHQIPRYYMQVRYGSMFSKVKHVRIFSYFADALLFHDGALWRDA